MRVIEDRASTALPEFSNTYEFASPQNTPDSAAACEGGESAEIYQYGLYYDPRNGHSPTTTNCGMFYIIRLSDNRLVMIDGGDCMQCSVEALEGMYRFLRRITGTAEGRKSISPHGSSPTPTATMWRPVSGCCGHTRKALNSSG